MLRLADGDRSAFDPLYDALWPLVRRLTDRMLRGAPEAEDAAQEAMAKVFACASRFESGRSVTTWVLAMTAYECKTLRQKQRRRREYEPLNASWIDGAVSPEQAAIARDLEQAAREVLGALRPVDIETLQAAMSGTRPPLLQATFRKRLERALARLRATWSSRHGLD
jgi:RNA polymerase sigma factor (sigma-70 family)